MPDPDLQMDSELRKDGGLWRREIETDPANPSDGAPDSPVGADPFTVRHHRIAPRWMLSAAAVAVLLAGLAAGLLSQSGSGNSAASGPSPALRVSPALGSRARVHATVNSHRPTSAPAAPVASGSHELDVEIKLDRTAVKAGDPITGEAIVTNDTSHPLTIADCNGQWIQVGLMNATVSYDPLWAACLSGTTLPVGTTRIPIRVSTTYSTCTQHASSATADTPACLDGPAMPPLPAGSYTTKTVMLEPKGVPLPTPNTIQVTLTS